jgi:hypothetical protein
MTDVEAEDLFGDGKRSGRYRSIVWIFDSYGFVGSADRSRGSKFRRFGR